MKLVENEVTRGLIKSCIVNKSTNKYNFEENHKIVSTFFNAAPKMDG